MDEARIKEIELERKIKEVLGENYVCMVFDKDLTMGEFLKKISKK